MDNCPNYANADQADGDSDGIGDGCDPLDDRTMPLLQDLLAATKAANVGKTLESKVQHAITSFDRGDDKGAARTSAPTSTPSARGAASRSRSLRRTC